MSEEFDLLTDQLDVGDEAALRAHLEDVSVRMLARHLRRLGRDDLLAVFEVLGEERAGEVVVLLDANVRAELLEHLPRERAIELFALLDPDDRGWLVQQLPSSVGRELLDGLAPPDRALTRLLMAHPAGSAGRAMSPHVFGLPADQSAGDALARVSHADPATETIYMLPVVDQAGVVVGVVSLRRLLLSPPEVTIADLMSSPAVVVRADQDQEAAARLVRDAQLIAAPVVDSASRLVGVLTVDDAMRILADAEDEDVARGTGAERLRRPYLLTSIPGLVRSRIGWLMVLIVAATLTVNVLDHFEATLAEVVTLGLFVPLLIGTGGNAGAQSATTVVRAMAVGDVRNRDLPRVVLREALTGLMLGMAMALIAFFPATYFAGRPIAEVVCLSLVAICMLATTVGSATPILARMTGIDPAVVSAPFISTIVDATGLIVYFLTAQVILGIG